MYVSVSDLLKLAVVAEQDRHHHHIITRTKEQQTTTTRKDRKKETTMRIIIKEKKEYRKQQRNEGRSSFANCSAIKKKIHPVLILEKVCCRRFQLRFKGYKMQEEVNGHQEK